MVFLICDNFLPLGCSESVSSSVYTDMKKKTFDLKLSQYRVYYIKILFASEKDATYVFGLNLKSIEISYLKFYVHRRIKSCLLILCLKHPILRNLRLEAMELGASTTNSYEFKSVPRKFN